MHAWTSCVWKRQPCNLLLQPFWYNSSLAITFAWNWHFINQDFLDFQDKIIFFLISHFFSVSQSYLHACGVHLCLQMCSGGRSKQWELQRVLNSLIFQSSKHERFKELEKIIMSCTYFLASASVYNILTSPPGQSESSFCTSGLLLWLQHLSLIPHFSRSLSLLSFVFCRRFLLLTMSSLQISPICSLCFSCLLFP